MDDRKERQPDDATASEPSRRAFVKTAGLLGAASAMSPWDVIAETTSPPAPGEAVNLNGEIRVTMRVNGKRQQLLVDPRTSLLDCLRDQLGVSPSPATRELHGRLLAAT